MRDLIRELWDIRRGRGSDVGGPVEMWDSEDDLPAPGEDPGSEAVADDDADSEKDE